MAHNITTWCCFYSGYGSTAGSGTSICCACGHLFKKKKKKKEKKKFLPSNATPHSLLLAMRINILKLEM